MCNMCQRSLVEEFKEQTKAFASKVIEHFRSENLVCKVYMDSEEVFLISNLEYKMSANYDISIFIKITNEMMVNRLNKVNTNKMLYINKIEFYDGNTFVASRQFTNPEYLLDEQRDIILVFNFCYSNIFDEEDIYGK